MDKTQLPFICYSSRRKMLFLLIGSSAFVALGIYLIFSPKPDAHFAGYLSLAFFGICALTSLIFLIRRIVLFTVTEEGIIFTKNNQLIKWAEIAEFRVVKQNIPMGLIKPMNG